MEEPVTVRESSEIIEEIDAAPGSLAAFDAFRPKGKQHLGKDAEVTVKEDVYCYDLRTPCYIDSVCIESSRGVQKELSFTCVIADQEFPVEPIARGARGESGRHRYEYRIGKLVNGFRLRSTDSSVVITNPPLVSRVQVYGASHAELLEAAEIYESFSVKQKAVMDEIRAEQARLGELSEKITVQERGIDEKISLIEQKLAELSKASSRASTARREMRESRSGHYRERHRERKGGRGRGQEHMDMEADPRESHVRSSINISLVLMFVIALAGWKFF